MAKFQRIISVVNESLLSLLLVVCLRDWIRLIIKEQNQHFNDHVLHGSILKSRIDKYQQQWRKYANNNSINCELSCVHQMVLGVLNNYAWRSSCHFVMHFLGRLALHASPGKERLRSSAALGSLWPETAGGASRHTTVVNPRKLHQSWRSCFKEAWRCEVFAAATWIQVSSTKNIFVNDFEWLWVTLSDFEWLWVTLLARLCTLAHSCPQRITIGEWRQSWSTHQ